MTQRVAAMDVRMATAAAGGVGNVAAFCAEQGISRQTFYKWRRRFAEGGIDGLAERSRRPVRHPGMVTLAVEDAVVSWRKRLADDGLDNGPDTIGWHLQRDPSVLPGPVPSRSTIWRILVRRGQVVPAPRKRPKSSLHRFVYPRPNDCWQADWTRWTLADGSSVAVAGVLDDHSRMIVGLAAAPGDATSSLVWATFMAGVALAGIPARSLTDNGLVYSAKRRNGESDYERNLRALGVHPICSSPYHPQTCGKIERFWQTLKRWLNAHDPAATLDELNALLTRFATHYNQHRPHRAIGRRTPAEAFAATVTARPASRPLPAPVLITTTTVHTNGNLPVGPYLVNVGARWAGHHVTAIRENTHIAIFSQHRIVRVLDADPTHRYQPGAARYDLRGHREPTPLPH